MADFKPNMMLIHSEWNKQASFRMIPLDINSCYQEAIYDPSSKVMVLISKVSTEKFTMVPKLDDKGDLMPLKGKQGYKQERRMVPTYQEYYLQTEAEILAFMDMFAVNYKDFSYMQYMHPVPEATAPQGMSVVKEELEEVK